MSRMLRRLLTSRSLLPSLEDRHQTKLFNRIGRHIELTDAGQAFLKEARAVLATVEAAELALIEFDNLKRGVLTVQASQTIANYWLPRHLAAFRRAYPQIEVRANIGNTAQVATAVENRETELGFVEAAIHSEQLTSAAVARDQIIVVRPRITNWSSASQSLRLISWKRICDAPGDFSDIVRTQNRT
jgi:DNA-binding transcriptional LysR family regulator